MFATIPVNISTYLFLDRAPNSAKLSSKSMIWGLFFLTLTTVVFRAEVALLLAPLCLQLLYKKQISFLSLVKVGLVSGLFSLALTLVVDSYFWNAYPLWPEFSGIYFNVVEGKSAEWGTSPPLTYVTSYLPKLLLGAFPLSALGFVADKRIRSLLIPFMAFIALISNLGHKEWRFIVYVVPPFNIAAARGARWMVSYRKNSLLGRVLFLIASGIIVANVIITALFTTASVGNYPGGQALSEFHRIYSANETTPPPCLHISNLAAQTGASLFLQLNSPPYYFSSSADVPRQPWTYNKTENLPPDVLSSSTSPFAHLISETSPTAVHSNQWQVVASVNGFDRFVVDWELLKGGKGGLLSRPWTLLRLEESEKLWILERKGLRSK
ncbi:glycosyltransferase family 22 protein [Hebeloma cylindrosporum]|uniref:Mannosyltransferase n=1 Tax=Hebeloma cylindrosporum TaxID=76867 RepID=A0A0C3CF84_HEBCY|nr:glycosyltransferase family 22 protein [Hebeloma cylindrosporum h7]